MQLANYVAHDLSELIATIPFMQYEGHTGLLIQIFCGTSIDDLGLCGKVISERLPLAVVIGATSEGQIHDSEVSTQSIIASFACFEKTRLAVAAASDADDFSHGRDIASRIACEAEARLMILLSDGSHTNGEQLLAGVASVSTVPIAGGMASDNATFNRTAVLYGDKIIKHGAVGVALIGRELSIKTNYAFSWFPIGEEFWVTRAQGNRVYTIGNLSSVAFYQKYLGKAVADRLPATGVEYPLIMMRDGMTIARACLKKLEDGSLIFAGDVPTGAKVSLSYGDTELILKETAQRTLDLHQCEAVFFYSCMARRRFLGDIARKELLWRRDLASSGFFTYGEFFSKNRKNYLLNETLTIVGLDEDARAKEADGDTASNHGQAAAPKLNAVSPSVIQVLSHFTRAITNDYGRMISLVNQAGVAITEWIETDGSWLPVYLSDAFEPLSGYSAESFVLGHTSLLSIVHPDDLNIINRAARRARAHEGELIDARFRIIRQDGGILYIHAHMALAKAAPVEMQNPTLVATLQDITAQHELVKEKELASYHATHDMLTNLYNRIYLREELAACVQRLQHRKGFGALIFIDLDQFKQINDTKGHQIGDEVLIETAKRLRRHSRAGDIPCRLGGDEFIILEDRLADSLSEASHNAGRIAEKLLAVIKEPYRLPPNEFHISASIGIAMIDGCESPENLMRFADNAMYLAKESGKDTYRFFDHALQEAMEERIAIQNRIRHTLENGGFSLVYQPQTKTNPDQHIVGVEALIRWQDEELGVVPPSSLIPIAEASGLIIPIGYWVFRQAARQIRAWRNDPQKSPWRISINISSKQFQQPDFVTRVKAIAKDEEVSPNKLRLELTESLLVGNAQSSRAKIEELIEAGFSLSIDDFGTGYSSLSYLKLLPVHELKIDQSFIRDIAIDPSDKVIVATIISIAHQFGLEVIAEGVETQEQVDILHSLGCSLFQGYLFSKPVSADLL